MCQYVCSLGIEPTTFALLTQCSTTEPLEHILSDKLNRSNMVHSCYFGWTIFMYCVLEIDVEMVKSEKWKNGHRFNLTI